jgi:TIR domain-containing protein
VSGPTTSAEALLPRVFISYRREECAAHAGRLYDAMAARFGDGNVFMDVDMAPGVDFVERITQVVSACQVLILVMGSRWASVTDQQGNLRLEDPDDFVRLELKTALQRPEVTPIPVLVGGARMPRREDLPEEIGSITRRNAIELSDGRWRYDVDRLNGRLDELLAGDDGGGEALAPPTPPSTPVPPPSTPAPPPSTPAMEEPAVGRSTRRVILEGMLVAAVAAFLARWAADWTPKLTSLDQPARAIGGVVLRRTEAWAVTGAAIAVWVAWLRGRPDLFRTGLWGLLIGAVAGAVAGLLWAYPVLHDPPYEITDFPEAHRIEVLSLALTGGILGAIAGSLWRPPRIGAGLLGGAFAAALFQLLLNASGWDNSSRFAEALTFALAGASIAGLALATMIAADQGRLPGARRTIPE